MFGCAVTWEDPLFCGTFIVRCYDIAWCSFVVPAIRSGKDCALELKLLPPGTVVTDILLEGELNPVGGGGTNGRIATSHSLHPIVEFLSEVD